MALQNLPRSVVAEFMGTLALVLIGCGSCVGGDQGEAAIDDQANTVRQINFSFSTLLFAPYFMHKTGALEKFLLCCCFQFQSHSI